MKEKLMRAVDNGIQVIAQLGHPHALHFMEESAKALSTCFKNGGKVLVAGNGGSLCDAVHFAQELTGFFRKPRKALPTIALSDSGHLTCVGNDMGFEFVFSRGIEAYGVPGDIFVGLTTSGRSLNMVRAFSTAKERGLKTIAFLGKEGGALRGVADLELIIRAVDTSDRIQEAHMAAIHMIIELVEEDLISSPHMPKAHYTSNQLESVQC